MNNESMTQSIGAGMADVVDVENDEFLRLLTEPLRRGPASPEWQEAGQAPRASGAGGVEWWAGGRGAGRVRGGGWRGGGGLWAGGGARGSGPRGRGGPGGRAGKRPLAPSRGPGGRWRGGGRVWGTAINPDETFAVEV